MKITFIALTIFFAPIILLGQADTTVILPKRNTIYIEAFGQGLLNSISIDRLYHIDKRVKTSFTLGLTILPVPIDSWDLNPIYGIPISYNWLFGQKKNHLEIGVGLTYMVDLYRG